MQLEQLPHKFKKVALIIIFLTIGFLIFTKTSDLNLSKNFIKTFTKVSFILAGYIFIIAKEKTEDEFIQTVRLKAIAFAFLFGVFSYIIGQVFNFFEPFEDDPFLYFFNMIFMYIFYFYLLKYGVIEKSAKSNKGTK